MKEVRVSVRVSPSLKARLQEAEKITGLPETQVVIRSLEAYCDYVEKTGEITVPFVLLPRSASLENADFPDRLAAENVFPYDAPKSPPAKKPPRGARPAPPFPDAERPG